MLEFELRNKFNFDYAKRALNKSKKIP